MIAYFPIPQEDELLTSVIARYVHEQGLRDDKVALDWLFGCRTVIPSPLLQGHIHQLLMNVGHLWQTTKKDVIAQHTILPIFKSFIPHNRYTQLEQNLINGSVNTSTLRSGINASLLNWPKTYKVCPLCWQEDQQTLGYNFWRRHFQLPGVNCCWRHSCYLVDTGISIYSIHRHHFVGTEQVEFDAQYTEVASPREVLLAQNIYRLFTKEIKVRNWSNFYKYLAQYENLMNGKRIDHQKISSVIKRYWGEHWLQQVGLCKGNDTSWLLAMFRKHRQPFSYLHHLVVLQAAIPNPEKLQRFLLQVEKLTDEGGEKHKYSKPNNLIKLAHSRKKWLRLLSVGKSLKQMRSKKIGARLYSWLFRYDNRWLQKHKPLPIKVYKNLRVDWQERDRKLVRQLIIIERSTEFDMIGPRRSRSWYASQLGCKSLFEKKLSKLPLCAAFFIRYAEDVEEYQTRRLARVCANLITSFDRDKPLCEVEKAAGLSRQRIRYCAKYILQHDVPSWFSKLSDKSLNSL